MRLNKFIASASTLSRRTADAAIAAGRVQVNGTVAKPGDSVTTSDSVVLDGTRLQYRQVHTTIMLNKPVGYVCSRKGQGSQTIFDLLPPEYQHLQPVGRLDKDSSGLLLLTDDGELANQLTHPRYQKTKAYQVTLDKPLQPLHQQMISDHGVMLEDGLSQFSIQRIENPRAQRGRERVASGGMEATLERSDESTSRGASPSSMNENEPATDIYQITMHEGRNRQIRRTFAALGYTVKTLHRTQFGSYALTDLKPGALQQIT